MKINFSELVSLFLFFFFFRHILRIQNLFTSNENFSTSCYKIGPYFILLQNKFKTTRKSSLINFHPIFQFWKEKQSFSIQAFLYLIRQLHEQLKSQAKSFYFTNFSHNFHKMRSVIFLKKKFFFAKVSQYILEAYEHKERKGHPQIA